MGEESKHIFRFTPFDIIQKHNAHKVGTDSVLLGCYAAEILKKQSATVRRVLDIGTGTGVLALIMAAFFPKATIDAIEINAKSAEEAARNFGKSKFSERLKAQCIALQQFLPAEPYDLIITNPPYFHNDFLNTQDDKAGARHALHLTLPEIIDFANRYLSEKGFLTFVVPQNIWKKYRIEALEKLWLAGELICPLRHTALSVIILSKSKVNSITEMLHIRDENGNYTERFRLQTNAIYLPEAYRGKS